MTQATEMDTRFGTWKVKRLYKPGSLETGARELAKCELDAVSARGQMGQGL
jgi:hypothetical protein